MQNGERNEFVAEPEQDLTKERTSVVESGVADPAPLGLAAFALTTFAFSIVNAGLLGVVV